MGQLPSQAERHTEQNIEELIGELEGMVYGALEQPDEVHTSLEYQLDLGNGYGLEFRDATGSEENSRSTAVFLFRNVEPADEYTCSMQLFFHACTSTRRIGCTAPCIGCRAMTCPAS